MITDEQLVERLRSSMHAATSDVFPPPDLLAGISPARRRRFSAPRFSAPRFGGLVVAFATVSTIAIAVVAIVSLGHTRASVTRTATPLTQPAPAANTFAALRSELAILRRPQSAPDRVPGWGISAEEQQRCSNCLNVAKVVPGGTRLLATIRVPRGDGPGPERIYLALGTIPKSWGNGRVSGWRQSSPTINGLHLSLFGLKGRRSTYGIDELLNPVRLAMPADDLTPRDVIITGFATVGLVPDGVTKVKWELDNAGQAKPTTVYPRVHGNVAIAPWTPAPRYTHLVNEQLLAGATWYGPGGRVIATFGDLAQINQDYGPVTPPKDR